MRKTIYIVEDNTDIGYILSYFLDEEGFNVNLFETIADFHAAINHKLPDLCLLDVMLPDGDGIQLCDQIKHNHRSANVPVLIMSAHAPARLISKHSCANGFIEKPFDLDVVLDRINKQF